MRKWLAGRATDIIKDIYQGKFYVRGFTNPICVDPIAFMEWAMYRDVDKIIGFLNKGDEYKGEHIFLSRSQHMWSAW
ncbi:hypothetical protein BC351_08355 [Paenibacillus ferrarius]|uniref:Uncharacterized protein n=1 Tax=Paenibacillus ferrarius TaxID=1469647 RepID=A0A1V4HAB6_9BACL|nr:hypothetical protein BC351_08355 [Paenibacillus ferrarius]